MIHINNIHIPSNICLKEQAVLRSTNSNTSKSGYLVNKLKLAVILLLMSFPGLAQAQLLPTEDPAQYPGYTDPTDFSNTCFDLMGAVDFISGYRFKSQVVNGASDVMYGFSIPLVADLNGDGYPEIIGISSDGTVSAIEGKYNGIQILNGQTGKLISKIKFPWLTAGYYYHLGHHGSPSIMALVDSDRDGTVEIIFTIPNQGGVPAAYQNDVISCNINYNPATKTYSLVERWRAQDFHTPAAAVNYEKPIPQVVDLDGDGIPEVVVYNKIYNAQNGNLLFTLETLGTNAFVGNGVKAGHLSDNQIGFSYIYDMDLDGIYDIVAGGKIYKMTVDAAGKLNGYQVITMDQVPDGRTGVADINGDGIPDVVSVTRNTVNDVTITVWNPGFWQVNSSTGEIEQTGGANPHILAQLTLPLSYYSTASTGSNSYVYIGDIDGRVQTINGKDYRLPEIAILGGRYTFNSNIHPNVVGLGLPVSGLSSSVGTGSDGVLAAVTWDATNGLSSAARLKLSFILGHNDSSTNTGFTMFDFDNDGIQEICYRDENNLRIIKAIKPYVTASETKATSPDVIKFSEVVRSYTGFEYPVIADVDNDASAEMIVMGHELGAGNATGYVYSVGSNGDKFAPALPVWNQFMYDPFKINSDLTTPIGPAPNRLKTTYNFKRLIKNGDGTVIEVIEKYNPYNGTLTQMPKYELRTEINNGVTYENVFEPIIFLTEAYVVNEKDPTESKRPKIITGGYIEVYIGNRATAKTDIALSTPISIYKGAAVSKSTFVKKVQLSDSDILFNGSATGKSAIKAGEEVLIRIPITDIYGSYIIRLGDDSDMTTDPVTWRFGLNYTNETTGLRINDLDNKEGTSSRAYRDCNWSDQTAKAALLVAVDDTYTLQEYNSVEFPSSILMSNDKLPSVAEGTFVGINLVLSVNEDGQTIDLAPKAGTVKFENDKFIYTHNKASNPTYGVDNFTYQVQYRITATNQIVSSMAKVHIFIMEDNAGGFAACYNESHDINLKNYNYTKDPSPDDPDPQPEPDIEFYWYESNNTEIAGNPQNSMHINAVTADITYNVKPEFKYHKVYSALSFPAGELKVSVVGQSASDKETLVWTGVVDNNWSNPNNWQDEGGNSVSFAPTSCVNAHIPQIAKPNNYPTIGSSVSAINNLSLDDRAMIQNLNKLSYQDGSMVLILKAAELNKWLMLSPVMAGMVVGDFMAYNNADQLQHKNTYIHLKESAAGLLNVYGASVASANQSVGKTTPLLLYIDGTKLGSGDAYTIKLPAVTGSGRYLSYDKLLTHPIGFAQSEVVSQEYGIAPAQRSDNNKFAATGMVDNFEYYPIVTDGAKYVMVVNPYPAYLSLTLLFAANTDFESDRYKVWNGADDFLKRGSYYNENDGGQPLWVFGGDDTFLDGLSTTIGSGENVYIAPFQSFFIKMKNQDSNPKVILDNSMTTTKLDDGVENGGYSLVK